MKFNKFSILIFLVIVLFIVEITFTICICNYKNNTYISLSGVVSKKNIGMFVVDNKELKVLYKNKYLYLDGKRYKYKIKSITRNVLVKNKINYHEVLLVFKFNSSYKDEDILNISIRDNKEIIIKMFKLIWKGVIT